MVEKLITDKKYDVIRKELGDESAYIKYYKNSTIEINIDNDSVEFFLDNSYSTDDYSRKEINDLLKLDKSECKKELNEFFEFLDKNKIKYDWDSEAN